MNQLPARREHDDPRMVAETFILGTGSVACFLMAIVSFCANIAEPRSALLATGVVLCILVLLYRKTPYREVIVGIGAIVSLLWSLVPFLLTGNFYYLALGISIPVVTTISGSVRVGVVIGCVFAIAGLGSAIAIDQKWIVPAYSTDGLVRGYLEESIAVITVLMFALVATIWVERSRLKAEEHRRKSDANLEKQLQGLKILAETTEELLANEVHPEGWIELLNRVADHIGCDVISNYEYVGNRLRLRLTKGVSEELKAKYQEIQLGEKVCGYCALTRKAIYLNGRNLETHEQGAMQWQIGIRAIVAVPLLYGKQLIGTMAFGSTSKDSLTEEDINFAKMVGQFVASIRGRELANEAADEALKRLEKLAGRLPGVVFQFRLRPDGTFCFPYTSKRMFEIHGVHPHEIVEDGSKVVEFHHPDDTALLMQKIYEAKAEHRPLMHAFRLRFGPDNIRWISINSMPEIEPDGSTLFHGYMADVTSQVHTQQTLLAAHHAAEAANRAKSEFLANMSHEIRTPMTAILGYTDILAGGQQDGQLEISKDDCIATIKRNGEQLLSIINDILDISKIEADKLELEHIEISPARLAQEVIDLMKLKAQMKGLTLNLEINSPVPSMIQTDPTRLRQILVNLVGNAIKFTEKGGVTVSIRASTADASLLCFDVMDTGIGIEREQVSKLFRPFEQADPSTTRKFGGTGLGLRISKRLAEMLGGDIVVSSTLGSGSNFTLTIATKNFPLQNQKPATLQNTELAQDKAPQNSCDNQDDTNSLPLNGLRILLVEDGVDNQRLISFHLSKAGAQVDIAENGKLAVERLCEQGTMDGSLRSPLPVDLVLMDMQMPEMDGYQATTILRDKGCGISILALTAHAMESDRLKCMEAGCDGWLTKPIEKALLISTCRHWGFTNPKEATWLGAPTLAADDTARDVQMD